MQIWNTGNAAWELACDSAISPHSSLQEPDISTTLRGLKSPKCYYTWHKLWTAGLLSEGTFLLTWRDHMDLSIINHQVGNINVEYK